MKNSPDPHSDLRDHLTYGKFDSDFCLIKKEGTGEFVRRDK